MLVGQKRPSQRTSKLLPESNRELHWLSFSLALAFELMLSISDLRALPANSEEAMAFLASKLDLLLVVNLNIVKYL